MLDHIDLKDYLKLNAFVSNKGVIVERLSWLCCIKCEFN